MKEKEESMKANVSLETVYVPSEDIVIREIEGELIVVPLVSGIGDLEDELFTMNATGRAIMEKLDKKKSLKDVVNELSLLYKAPADEIEQDVVGFMEELLKRRMIVKVSRA
ncbi:MAG: PqqD family protein [Candidatus Aminicenantaceae bacterium]